MRPTQEIRRRPDGSIDTDYYVRIGRRLHGKAVGDTTCSLLGTLAKGLRLVLRGQVMPAGTLRRLVRGRPAR